MTQDILKLWRESNVADEGEYDDVRTITAIHYLMILMNIGEKPSWRLKLLSALPALGNRYDPEVQLQVDLDESCYVKRASSAVAVAFTKYDLQDLLDAIIDPNSINVSVGLRQVGEALVPARIVFHHQGGVCRIDLK
jgi:hypothetical protein